ncbi:MAG: hypothetical protein JWO36_4984 [Myxococcales bacterium]|nr:hypothetical protein [Myxococcales bacterium]
MQLTRAIVVVALCVAPARGDTGFTSKVQVYSDSDHTQVISPIVQAQADVSADTNVSLGYTVDAVSSASVDIVSQASPTVIHDNRHQASAGMSHTFGSITARGGYSYSKENDYLSHSFELGLQDELFDKNTTLAIGYGLSLNSVGRANDTNFERSLTVQHIATSWTQVISQRLIAQLTYELGYASGFQASPYRFVPVRMSPDAAPDFWVPETDPDTRWRHAIVVGINRAIGEDSSVQGDYRFYLDTWGITSHTFGARYFAHLAKRVELRLRNRLYTQNAASFYQSTYTAAAKYITFDRELSPLWSETIGTKLTYGFSDHVEGELKLDVFYYSYADFTPLLSRTGANVGLGVSLTY